MFNLKQKLNHDHDDNWYFFFAEKYYLHLWVFYFPVFVLCCTLYILYTWTGMCFHLHFSFVVTGYLFCQIVYWQIKILADLVNGAYCWFISCSVKWAVYLKFKKRTIESTKVALVNKVHVIIFFLIKYMYLGLGWKKFKNTCTWGWGEKNIKIHVPGAGVKKI